MYTDKKITASLTNFIAICFITCSETKIIYYVLTQVTQINTYIIDITINNHI